MTWRSDDLTPSLVPPDPEFAGYGQALIVEFDRETFDNVILYRGGRLTNLPVLDRIGATTYQAGDVVLLMKWRPTGGGLGSYWIAGAPVVPGAGQAEAAVAFLRGELAKQISAEINAAGIHNDSITNPLPEETTSTTFTDLTTVGPTVPNVEISPAGKALVILSAALLPAVNDSAVMSFEVTGASSIAPNNNNILALLRGAELVVPTTATVIPVDGLNPGVHQFRAKYRSEFGGAAGFSNRGVTVIAY